MKIVFFGDSITDAWKNPQATPGSLESLGLGYVRQVAGALAYAQPGKHEVINSGISGHRIVDLYARVKKDVWNYSPDVLSILIGVNDVWHQLSHNNGVEIDRFEKVYDMLLEDTLKAIPDVKIILCEPFIMHGTATDNDYDKFSEVFEYAKAARKLAQKYGLYFLPLQDMLDSAAKKYPGVTLLSDGVHPAITGASFIAEEWLKFFNKNINK